jgi:acyl-coenzyme A synthetase/AMP-(fatty) acid ligase
MTRPTRAPLAESLADDGPPPPCPARFNLAAHALWAGQDPARVALTVAGPDGAARERWSYGALREAVGRTAGGLRALGLRPGERVMLRLGNSADFPILFLGTVAAGGVAVPTSAMLSAAEALHVATDVGARFVAADAALRITGPGFATLGPGDVAALRGADPMEPAPTAADDPAFVVYTSGSSGRPKGVAHAQRSAWARRMMWAGWYGLRSDDVMLHAGAFNWTYTLGAGLLDPWAAGASTVIYDGPRDPGVWARLAAAHRATLFAAAPGVYRQLVKYGENLADGFVTLRHGLSAGETLVDALAAAWTAETGKPIHEALGMSEVSTYVSSSPDAPRRAGRVGRPQPGRRVAVLSPGTDRPAPIGETGDLAVSRRDPGLMLGYWGDPAGTAAAMRGEWFVTGDLAAMDADGYLAYGGRADDLMNAGGYRVGPEEVEAALSAHPAVREAAVTEVRVAEGLSVIAAFVVADPASGLDEAALVAWCRERLAAYKTPKRVTFLDALPRTGTGKLRRRALAAGA